MEDDNLPITDEKLTYNLKIYNKNTAPGPDNTLVASSKHIPPELKSKILNMYICIIKYILKNFTIWSTAIVIPLLKPEQEVHFTTSY